MKKHVRTIIFATLTLVTVSIVYIFDYVSGNLSRNAGGAEILNYNKEQINYIQVIKGEQKIGLQKNEEGWSLREPIQDQGDNDNIEAFLIQATQEKPIAVVKEASEGLSEIDLREFGLDNPAGVFNFKNNLGHTKKISIGSVKSYEGNTYLRVDADNRIFMASPFWSAQAQNDMIYYRIKKLFRGNLSHIERIKIRSLRDNFELIKQNNIWKSGADHHALDQNRIRELMRKIAETKIENYLFEGEPSVKLLNEKGLNDGMALMVEIFSADTSWNAKFNLSVADKALYAFTERPTFLVRVEIDAWEMLGNLRLDDLRDRASALAFSAKEVAKIYYKSNGSELDLVFEGGQWKIKGHPEAQTIKNESVLDAVEKMQDLKISEFLDAADIKSSFEGDNMLILRSTADKLLLQLNWGPEFSMKKAGVDYEYFYARTHLHEATFALEKSLITGLGLEKLDGFKGSGAEVKSEGN